VKIWNAWKGSESLEEVGFIMDKLIKPPELYASWACVVFLNGGPLQPHTHQHQESTVYRKTKQKTGGQKSGITKSKRGGNLT
jgi:lipopolysaccharide export LptBFGC system permease protein LptF